MGEKVSKEFLMILLGISKVLFSTMFSNIMKPMEEWTCLG